MKKVVKACEDAVVYAAMRWYSTSEDSPYRAAHRLMKACLQLRLARNASNPKPRRGEKGRAK